MLSRRIYIGGFKKKLTRIEILFLFQRFGPVEDVIVNIDSKSGDNRGSGFVVFEDQKTASKVASLNLKEVGSVRMIVVACLKDPSNPSNKSSLKLTDSTHESHNTSRSTIPVTN